NEAGVERQRAGIAKSATEKPAEDQDTLGMQRTAECHFALDIDDLAAPEPDARGDASGVAERETAERHYREAVDLAYLLAVGLDPDRLAADLLLQAAVNSVPAAELPVDRLLHLDRRHDAVAGAGGQLVGLLQQIDDFAQPRGQPFGIAGEPRRPLDDARHG